jgi:protein SCO1/2
MGGLVGAFLLCLSTEDLPAQAGMPSVDVFDNVGIDQKLDEKIPLDLPFLDESGRGVLLGEYFGIKPVILSLVYYNCPMLCTQVLNGMVESFKVLDFTAGKEFTVITVSIDSRESDTLAAEKKRLYVEAYGRQQVGPGWHFLTGEEASIKALAGAVGFRYVFDEKTGQFAHASGIMVLTPDGKIARYLYGIEYPVKDLMFSLMEAAQNRIGSPVDKLLLLCYHYDPSTGRYGVLVTSLLRGGGVVCIALLGGYMIMSIWRERIPRRKATG